MQSLRLKLAERRTDWSCCFCCHVRTGTIFLGIFHVLINLSTLSLFAVTVNSDFFDDEDMNPALPTPLSEVELKLVNLSGDDDDMSYFRPQPPLPHSYRTVVPLSQKDLNISIFFTICTLGLSLLLLYGAIKRKAAYLMPFFGYQVFNFCITSMAVVGYLCYPPNLDNMLQQNQYIPFKNELGHMNAQVLNVYAMFAIILVMMIKAYFIGVVWSCYKYLSLRQVAAQRTLNFIDVDNHQNLIHDQLPDYDTAVKKFPTPPPSYSAAVLNQAPGKDFAASGGSAFVAMPSMDGASASTAAPETVPAPLQPWHTIQAAGVAKLPQQV